MERKITVVTSRFDGESFPEAERYDEYLAEVLASSYEIPLEDVTVVFGHETRVIDDGEFGEGDIMETMTSAWVAFCEHDYKHYLDA